MQELKENLKKLLLTAVVENAKDGYSRSYG